MDSSIYQFWCQVILYKDQLVDTLHIICMSLYLENLCGLVQYAPAVQYLNFIQFIF